MALICEDLHDHGVVLVPPSQAGYFDLLRNIEDTLRNRLEGSRPVGEEALRIFLQERTDCSAILLNQAAVAIAAVAYTWWFPGEDGRSLSSSHCPGTSSSVLLPFGLIARSVKFHGFWDTIFPGSKRLMTVNRFSYGDNTDVRLPREDELWRGGFFTAYAGNDDDPKRPERLTLDGIFFADGGFIGEDRLGTWDSITSSAEAHFQCAAFAEEVHKGIASPADFFSKVTDFTGQAIDSGMPPPPPPPALDWSGPPDPEPIHHRERAWVGWTIQTMRVERGEDFTISTVRAWADAPVPRFHKL